MHESEFMIQAFSSGMAILIFYLVYFAWFLGEILKASVFPGSSSHGAKMKRRGVGSSILIGVIIFVSFAAFFFFTGYDITLSPNWVFYPGIVSLIFFLVYLIKIVRVSITPPSHLGETKIKEEDKGSALLIIVGNFVAIVVAFFFAAFNIALLPNWVFYLGVVLMILGVIVRQWSIAVLGRFFSSTVGVQKDQKVVDNGPYRLIRHPSYTGGFLFMIGLGLALQSWGTVLITLLIFSLVYGYRIRVEENALISKLGNEYVEYMKKTKKLIPYVL
jgi:protein-S-isoprenylcysteine O-methyltransferase Ste14